MEWIFMSITTNETLLSLLGIETKLELTRTYIGIKKREYEELMSEMENIHQRSKNEF